MRGRIDKAWDDLFRSAAEPRLSVQLWLAAALGVAAGVAYGAIFLLN